MAEHHREAAAFIVAAHWVAGLVQALPDTAWHGPGLGEWGMRALVGHTSRALLTVEQSLDTPVERADIDSAEDYYETVARAKIADAGMVLRRGVEAGEALGADPRLAATRPAR